MGIFGFINSIIVSMCTGIDSSGTTIVMTDTVAVTICTDAVSYYGCLHLVWLGVSDTVVFIFTTFDFTFSLGEIILSFIVLMITIFDFIFSDIVSRFFIKKFYRNLKILHVTMGDRKEVTFCSGFLFFGFPFL